MPTRKSPHTLGRISDLSTWYPESSLARVDGRAEYQQCSLGSPVPTHARSAEPRSNAALGIIPFVRPAPRIVFFSSFVYISFLSPSCLLIILFGIDLTSMHWLVCSCGWAESLGMDGLVALVKATSWASRLDFWYSRDLLNKRGGNSIPEETRKKKKGASTPKIRATEPAFWGDGIDLGVFSFSFGLTAAYCAFR